MLFFRKFNQKKSKSLFAIDNYDTASSVSHNLVRVIYNKTIKKVGNAHPTNTMRSTTYLSGWGVIRR